MKPWVALDRHLRVFGAAVVFAALAYGAVHLIFWLGRALSG
jgi:hypothetical protein